jgi:hypothetical protein
LESTIQLALTFKNASTGNSILLYPFPVQMHCTYVPLCIIIMFCNIHDENRSIIMTENKFYIPFNNTVPQHQAVDDTATS